MSEIFFAMLDRLFRLCKCMARMDLEPDRPNRTATALLPLHTLKNHNSRFFISKGLLRIFCWALIFILRLRFPLGSSITPILALPS